MRRGKYFQSQQSRDYGWGLHHYGDGNFRSTDRTEHNQSHGAIAYKAIVGLFANIGTPAQRILEMQCYAWLDVDASLWD